MNRIKTFVRNFDFQNLFVEELGWNNPPRRQPVTVEVGRETYSLKMLSEKSGFQVFLHESKSADQIPNQNTRKKFEKKLTEIAAEHLLIFTDAEKNRQIWQWARRESNMPLRTFTERFERGGDGERLTQKLQLLAISIEDEERGLGGITQIAGRVRTAFNVERVTKNFYQKFKAEHDAFSARIAGIENEKTRDWYASLMLNRLMFSYFIQAKKFLNGELDYLRKRLEKCQTDFGADYYFQFYRNFLLRLFHEGLGEGRQEAELIELIGAVPYLNGGLFDIHEIERSNPEINIADDAFERVFDFLDRYDWRLDDRPLRDESEINPDILGYIFEKYINQKQMGAYYTKEDITEYISKNTILPFLLDKVRAENRTSFDKTEGIWALLRENPDRYIYAAVRKGVIDETGEIVETPHEIVAGIDNVGERGNWNRTAAAPYGLPTETWREYWARRQRCLELRAKLQAGEVYETNDLITYNLDIRQFVQDAIEQSESPDFIRAFYRAVAGKVPEQSNEKYQAGISILDPTCGSGAFLFAALNVLEPLVQACLSRMTDFVEEADRAGANNRHKPFRRVLQEIEHHPNLEYFVLKSIVVGNLYGVDIMPEAVEICKLRLFLKLAAQVERDESKPNFGLEPLPDIDFNIRAGNTLVGFVDKASVNVCFDGADTAPRLGFAEVDSDKARFYDDVELAERAFEHFRLQQTSYGGKVTKEDKDNLREQLKRLSDKLNVFLACEYGVDTAKKVDFAAWYASHQPFHWLTEFYGIIAGGGFDVIIGNPPYLEMREIDYQIKDLPTIETAAVHAACIERSTQVLKSNGCMSMIVPLSLVSTQRMKVVQNLLEKNRSAWYSNYSWRPGKLFDTVNRALTIFVVSSSQKKEVFSNDYQKWNAENRNYLIQNCHFVEVSNLRPAFWVPKISEQREILILDKYLSVPKKVSHFAANSGGSKIYYRTDGGLYWKVFTDFAPAFNANGITGHSTRETWFNVFDENLVLPIIATLSSSSFWWYYTVTSNMRHLNPYDVQNFPIPESALKDEELKRLGKTYLKNLQHNSSMLVRQQRQTGRIETQSFKILLSKPIIDEIDRVLAKHYGFTDEELDFIINYDIKYRMGREEADEEN